jgi:hypothetical protein
MIVPAILRIEGFVFRIYTADHRPPRVHVFNGEGEAVFILEDEDGLPSLREWEGMREPDVRRAYRIVEMHRTVLLGRWREIHGE